MAESLGLIAGSGFAALGLDIVARSPLKTPYGAPSSAVLTVRIGAERLLCIARHGEAHALAPHEVNYRANLWALAESGVRTCIALNTVGAIERGFGPGDIAVPEQLIDYTCGRAASYGGEGRPVVHVEFTYPFAPLLRGRLAAAAADCGFGARGGCYGVTQGPRLETAAEIARLTRDGCTMVGMTAMPEAALARELGIDYAVCALAVNFAAGRSPTGEPIDAQIEMVLEAGMQRVGRLLQRVVEGLRRDAL